MPEKDAGGESLKRRIQESQTANYGKEYYDVVDEEKRRLKEFRRQRLELLDDDSGGGWWE